MDPVAIRGKFGGDFIADEATFKMGIHYRFADHIARRFEDRTVLETCSGGGFTAMALAKYARWVFTVEIDPSRVKQALSNARRAQVADKITFLEGDVLDEELLERLPEFDAAFLDPDWADTDPGHVYRFIDSNTVPPADVLLERIFAKTANVALVLPPAVDVAELEGLPAHERERLFLGERHELYCLYFGALAASAKETIFKI